MKNPPTGTAESFLLMHHFLANPLPWRRRSPGEPLPSRIDLTKGVDFETLELHLLAKISMCDHTVDASGFCTSCGLNKPGIAAFEEFLKKD